MIHVVKQGEHISTIAAEHGFCSFELIWNDPANAELRSKREDNPNVLYPGDEVFIPKKNVKTVSESTGQVYSYILDLQTLNLIFVLRDINGRPIPNCPCELELNDKVTKLTTDSAGKIDRKIPISTKSGKITARGIEYPFLVGHLDPVDTESGQRARLANLGYYLGNPGKEDPEEFNSAIEEFQCDYGLVVDGDCGPKTQKKLKEVHGS